MKITKILLALLFIATIVSCDADKNSSIPQPEVPTTSIQIGLKVVSQGSSLGGDGLPNMGSVNVDSNIDSPGGFPPFINWLNITAQNQLNNYVASRNYVIDNTNNAQGTSLILLEDVALGVNDFDALAKSDGIPMVTWGSPLISGNPATALDVIPLILARRAQSPDVEFNGRVEDIDILDPTGYPGSSPNTLPPVEFTMNANAGRLMAYFMFEDTQWLQNGYVVAITPIITDALGVVTTLSRQLLREDGILEFYGSDQAIFETGTDVCFLIEYCEAGSQTIIKSEYVCYAITNGESLSCVIVITEQGVKEEVTSFLFDFNWLETYCFQNICDTYITDPEALEILEIDFLWEVLVPYGVCNLEDGQFADATAFFQGNGGTPGQSGGNGLGTLTDGTVYLRFVTHPDYAPAWSNLMQLKNGTGSPVTFTITFASGGPSPIVVTVPPNSWFLGALPVGEYITDVVANNGGWTKSYNNLYLEYGICEDIDLDLHHDDDDDNGGNDDDDDNG